MSLDVSSQTSASGTLDSNGEKSVQIGKRSIPLLKVFGYALMVFAISGLIFDLFEMGRLFWIVFVLWVLILRLIITAKKPINSDFDAISDEQDPMSGTLSNK